MDHSSLSLSQIDRQTDRLTATQTSRQTYRLAGKAGRQAGRQPDKLKCRETKRGGREGKGVVGMSHFKCQWLPGDSVNKQGVSESHGQPFSSRTPSSLP